MKAVIDRDSCIGCGLCAEACPEVFAIMDDGYAHAIVDPVPHEEYDCVREAVDMCPVESITLTSS